MVNLWPKLGCAVNHRCMSITQPGCKVIVVVERISSLYMGAGVADISNETVPDDVNAGTVIIPGDISSSIYYLKFTLTT